MHGRGGAVFRPHGAVVALQFGRTNGRRSSHLDKPGWKLDRIRWRGRGRQSRKSTGEASLLVAFRSSKFAANLRRRLRGSLERRDGLRDEVEVLLRAMIWL